MNNILFVYLFYLLSSFVHAQNTDAVLYFNDGTELEGLGEIKNDKILFRLTQKDKADEWSYEDVRGIVFLGFDVKLEFEYVKIKKTTSPELLQLITKGEVNLYKKSPSFIEIFLSNKASHSNNDIIRNSYITDVYYVKRNTEELPTELKPISYRKIVKDYFSDCEALVEKINKGYYSLETIDKLVEYYDDVCSD